MKILFQILIAITIAAFFTGCASTGYLGDRLHDAGDIFTATVGQNYGAKARVGPFRAGLFCGLDYAGLRAGEIGLPFHPKSYEEHIDLEATFISAEVFHPADLETAKRRGKLYRSEGIIFFALPDDDPESLLRQQAPYYTQIEVAVGLFKRSSVWI